MAKPPKGVQIWILNEAGEFVPVAPAPPQRRDYTRCVPTPARKGFLYMPDWYGMTSFG